MALKDNLVAHWKLEESSSTRFDSHNSHDLTDNNTVTQTTGKVGNCASFTKANSEFLDRSSIDSTLKTGDFDWTIALWIQTPSSIGPEGIFAWGDGFATKSVELLTTASGLDVQVTDTGGAESSHTLLAIGSMSGSTWYYVTIRFDESAEDIVGRIDGGSNSTFIQTTVRNSPTVLRVGRERGGAYWDGEIDEMSFWNAYKSDSDLDEIYNSGSGLDFDDWDAGGGSLIYTPRYHNHILTR